MDHETKIEAIVKRVEHVIDSVAFTIPHQFDYHQMLTIVLARHSDETGCSVVEDGVVASSTGVSTDEVANMKRDLVTWGILKRRPDLDRDGVKAYQLTDEPYTEPAGLAG